MEKEVKISVLEAVGSSLCVASDDGQKVFDRLEQAIQQKRVVILSFNNITALTSAFLNAAIGQLYGVFSEGQIRHSLRLEDMEQDDIALLKRVVDTAKQYFKNPDMFNQIIEEEMEGKKGDEIESSR